VLGSKRSSLIAWRKPHDLDPELYLRDLSADTCRARARAGRLHSSGM